MKIGDIRVIKYKATFRGKIMSSGEIVEKEKMFTPVYYYSVQELFPHSYIDFGEEPYTWIENYSFTEYEWKNLLPQDKFDYTNYGKLLGKSKQTVKKM